MNGRDVTEAIRGEEATRFASLVAKREKVRAALLVRQKEFRKLPGLVADGRDMGTAGFPRRETEDLLGCEPRRKGAKAIRRVER